MDDLLIDRKNLAIKMEQDREGNGKFEKFFDKVLTGIMSETPGQFENKLQERIDEHHKDAIKLNKSYDKALTELASSYYRLKDLRKKMGLPDIDVVENYHEDDSDNEQVAA